MLRSTLIAAAGVALAVFLATDRAPKVAAAETDITGTRRSAQGT